MAFSGFPAEGCEFYDRLRVDNSKVFWAANKGTYEQAVRQPMIDLLAELEGEFGAPQVFRPHRDVRFSKDKTPYKDHQGGFVGAEDGIGWYVQLGREGLTVAGGWYSPQGQQIHQFRDSIDSAVGSELQPMINACNKKGLALGGDVMKTKPRGIAPDHPRLELLRHRSLTCSRSYVIAPWLSTRTTLTKVGSDWRTLAPLVEWLVDHVGPADDGPPPEPR